MEKRIADPTFAPLAHIMSAESLSVLYL